MVFLEGDKKPVKEALYSKLKDFFFVGISPKKDVFTEAKSVLGTVPKVLAVNQKGKVFLVAAAPFNAIE
jgi:hypothetical protein